MKFSIVLNSAHPLPVQLNALGHVAVGLAHLAPPAEQLMRTFSDAEGAFVGSMTDHPLIVLAARSGRHLHEAHLRALETQVTCNAFTIDMKEGEPVEQATSVAMKITSDLDYVALGLWGAPETLRDLTRRFSLFRA